MKITIRSGKTEMVYEADNPTRHPLCEYEGKSKSSDITNHSIPFERLIKLIETMSDNMVKMKNAKQSKQ